MSTQEIEKPDSPIARYAELAVALAVIALGIVVLWQTQDIRVTRATARVGPKVIPTIIGIGQIVVGVWYAVEIIIFHRVAVIEADSEDMDPDAPTDWVTLGFLGVALLAYTLLIKSGGFIVASAAMFIIAAFGMGSRRILRDSACAVVLSVAVFLIFDNWLGVRLPEGWLSGVL
jgi:putative tricarboxylic transport membrane protein